MTSLQTRQDVLGEQFAFIFVRIAGEDESPHSHVDVALQLGIDLIWIANDRASATRASPADAGPHQRLDKALFVRRLAKCILAEHAR